MHALRTALPLSLALLGAAAFASLVRLRAMDHYVASETYEDVYYVPPPEWLPVFSLGYDEAFADLLWTRALVYFGEEMHQRGALAHVFDYTDAMLALDPDFRAVYEWIGTAGLYRPQAITAEDAQRTIEYLRRGHERFPEDGELAWTLGAALAFELPPLLERAEDKEAARAEGAEYIMRAARLGAGPEWLAMTGATLLSRVGRAEAAVAHLEELYALAPSDEARAEIANAIGALRSRAHAEAMVEANRDEEERRLRELPYAPPSLYFLIGPRPVTRWREVYREGFVHDAFADEREVMLELTSED